MEDPMDREHAANMDATMNPHATTTANGQVKAAPEKPIGLREIRDELRSISLSLSPRSDRGRLCERLIGRLESAIRDGAALVYPVPFDRRTREAGGQPGPAPLDPASEPAPSPGPIESADQAVEVLCDEARSLREMARRVMGIGTPAGELPLDVILNGTALNLDDVARWAESRAGADAADPGRQFREIIAADVISTGGFLEDLATLAGGLTPGCYVTITAGNDGRPGEETDGVSE